jgi:antitoxin component HigA of HigAB toxin-antitoxin module
MSNMTEYRKLLTKYAPRPIRSEKDYRRMMAQLERVLSPRPDKAHGLLIEMLATLIDSYESKVFAVQAISSCTTSPKTSVSRMSRPPKR